MGSLFNTLLQPRPAKYALTLSPKYTDVRRTTRKDERSATKF